MFCAEIQYVNLHIVLIYSDFVCTDKLKMMTLVLAVESTLYPLSSILQLFGK